MSRKFTDEEISTLAANPYTYRVTRGQVCFTKEFKDLFWSEYQHRKTPAQIFREAGYDPKILGHGRISGFQQTLKKEVEAGIDFHNGPRGPGERRRLTSDDEEISRSEIRQMQHKVEYLEQEVEFLKKIFSTKNTRK